MLQSPFVVSSVAAALALAACGSVEKKPTDPDAPTAAERALEAHRAELLATPGVAAVDVTADRQALAVTVCGPEVGPRLDAKHLGARLETIVEPRAAGCRPAPVEDRVAIHETIEFGRDDDSLRGPANSIITKVARILADHPSVRVDIVGHSASGEKQRSQLLTRRAQAVRKALTDAGIEKIRLVIGGEDTTGKGESTVTIEVHPD